MRQAHLTVSQHITADDVHVFALTGEIDRTTADALSRALAPEDGRARRTVIDFLGVTFIDSSGINVLVAANNAVRDNGGWLRLSQTPRAVADLLHIVGLDDVIPSYRTLDEALAPRTAL